MAIARVVLAGWEIREVPMQGFLDRDRYAVYDKDGEYHGENASRAKAARYALQVMKRRGEL